MAKAIDKMEQTWTTQSSLKICFDMATEAMVLLMNHLASDEDSKIVKLFRKLNRTISYCD